MNLEKGNARRDELQEQTAEVLAGAPRTTTDAYDQAGEALKSN